MSTVTPRISAPLLAAAQAQKHVTHNEALLQLDALLNARILDRDLSAPPASPADGDAYLVKAAGTGAWAGQDGKIAFAVDGAWRFYAPFAGLAAFIADESVMLVYTAGGWVDWASIVNLENVPLVGVNTAADATNKFALKSNAALFAALEAASGGNGDMQVKLNKETAADTGSFLFQTSFSGRAEFGLTGNDDFHFKVSPDGAAWTEAFVIHAATGNAGFQTANSPNYTLSVNNSGNDGNAMAVGLLTIGASGGGGDYPGIGNNIRFSAALGAYTYNSGDTATLMKFGSSGRIQTFTAPSGAGGSAIAFIAGPEVAQGATSWSAPSDARLKTNIQTYSVLDKLSGFRAVSFDWLSPGHAHPSDIGVVAQELYKVFPQIVNVGSDGGTGILDATSMPWSVEYAKLAPIALEGLKELYDRTSWIGTTGPTATDPGADAEPALILNAETGNIGIGTAAPSCKFDVNGDRIRVRTAKTPATSAAPGNRGEIAWDASFVYVCIAKNAWKRAALASW